MISVCIATYNGEKYIKEQLESILSQLGEDDEVVISDDYSTDSTIDIINRISDKRIGLYANNIKRKAYHPAISNFENALNHAQGDYIFLSDQDDLWLDNKVSKTLYFLQRFDMVVSDCFVIDEYGNEIVNSFFKFNNSKKGLIVNLMKNNYIGCCMAFKRKILEKALPFPKDIPLHDLWLGFVAELFFKTTFISEKLIQYRRHAFVSSCTMGKSKNSFIKKVEFRMNCIKYIPLILFR
jgi:glycosyltransferase involved in cell wall biosynthesis